MILLFIILIAQIYCKFPSNAYIYLKKSSIVFGKTAEDPFLFYRKKLANLPFPFFIS